MQLCCRISIVGGNPVWLLFAQKDRKYCLTARYPGSVEKAKKESINVGILYPSNWKMHTFQPFQGRNARGFRLIRRSDHAELALKTKSASTFSGRPMRDHSQKLTEWPSQLKSLFPVIASYIRYNLKSRINNHYLHPEEITPAAEKVCASEANAAFPSGVPRNFYRKIMNANWWGCPCCLSFFFFFLKHEWTRNVAVPNEFRRPETIHTKEWNLK